MADTVLQVEGLAKRFGDFWAVRDLSFQLQRGEVVGFLGQNGSGKSTTIKMLTNLIRPTAGDIRLDGESILACRGAAHRQRLGAIVEAPRFYPHLSGARNLDLLARILGVGGARVAELLHEVGLAARSGEQFGRYSMGMKQRLGLAAVLLHRPSLIILDEPTTGLDPVGQEQIHALIKRLVRDDAVSVFLSSHQMDEVADLCDRAIVIHQGEALLNQPLRTPADMAPVRDIFNRLAREEAGGVGP